MESISRNDTFFGGEVNDENLKMPTQEYTENEEKVNDGKEVNDCEKELENEISNGNKRATRRSTRKTVQFTKESSIRQPLQPVRNSLEIMKEPNAVSERLTPVKTFKRKSKKRASVIVYEDEDPDSKEKNEPEYVKLKVDINENINGSVSPVRKLENLEIEQASVMGDNKIEDRKSLPKTRASRSHLDDIYEQLENIFPDLDPDYLRCQYSKLKGSLTDTIDVIVIKKKTGGLPTRDDYLKRLELERIQKKYTENFSVENFLRLFPDPWDHFLNKERNSGTRYSEHSAHYLKNKFKKHYIQTIQDALISNDYSLYLAYKQLQKKNRTLKTRAANRSKFECDVGRPTTFNIQFLQEVAFIENEEKIREHLRKIENAKNKKFKKAKKEGSPLECLSCSNPNLSVQDSIICPDAHIFCRNCVIRKVKRDVSEGNYQFKCLLECDKMFTIESLQDLLDPETRSTIGRKNQVEEMESSGIENLVYCPFCYYFKITPSESAIVYCGNSSCMKESCRFCKQLNHHPLPCNTLEKFNKVRKKEEQDLTEMECFICNRKMNKEGTGENGRICSDCQNVSSFHSEDVLEATQFSPSSEGKAPKKSGKRSSKKFEEKKSEPQTNLTETHLHFLSTDSISF